jgi:transcription antitermination factor NusG
MSHNLCERVLPKAWYAVRVRSRFEQVVSTALREKGYEEFVPLVRSRRRWSDRVKELRLPLFPGYVFCRFEAHRKTPILACPAVFDILAFANRPAAIPNEEIQAVRAMVESRLAVEPYPFLNLGQRIRIERGPLAGIEGLIVEIKNHYRLVASVTLLQRSVCVEIDREWAAKA